MPCKQFPHGVDQSRFSDRELRVSLLLQIFLAVLGIGEGGAKDEILDLDLSTRLLVATLDNGAGCAALVGVFELSAEIVLGIAEVKFCANVRGA